MNFTIADARKVTRKATRVAIILLVILFLILAASLIFTPHVTHSTPAQNSQNVALDTSITFSFNIPVNPKDFKITTSPEFTFQITATDSKTIVLKPTVPLSDATRYVVSINSPAKYALAFSTLQLPQDTQAGQSNEYQQAAHDAASQIKISNDYSQNLARFTASLPIETSTFKVEYILASNTFLVHLKGDQARAKSDFQQLLKSKGVREEDMTILYLDTQASFVIGQTNMTQGKVFGISDPVSFTFSQPVDRDTVEITFNPNVGFIPHLNPTATSITIDPATSWAYNQTYTVTVTGKSADEKDLDKPYTFTFTTTKITGI